jgi:hypothetical protein
LSTGMTVAKLHGVGVGVGPRSQLAH